MEITNIVIKKNNVPTGDEISRCIKLIELYMSIDAKKMLEFDDWYDVSFELRNTYSGFANGIRRALKEELPCTCLGFDEKDMQTDDDFLSQTCDDVMKQFNLLAIDQEIKREDFEEYNIFLNVHNNTSDVIQIRASDIKIVSKNGNEHIDSSNLLKHPRTIICKLRPSKFLKVTKFVIESGRQMDNASKFTFVNGCVKYNILDVIPYNAETKEGVRSAESNPTHFRISFQVNKASPAYTINVLVHVLTERLKICKNALLIYKEKLVIGTNDLYYMSDGLEVKTCKDLYKEYRFQNEYYTFSGMIAKKCYLIDPSIAFIAGTVEKFDNNICIIKINHPEPNNLLIKAIDELIVDIAKLKIIAK